MSDTTHKVPVKIEMKTVIHDEGRQHTNRWFAAGELFEKSSGLFLRFDEQTDDNASIRQTIKAQTGEMTVIRNGDVEMKQRFISNQETEGMYQSPYGPLSMVTKTKHVDVEWDPVQKTGSLHVGYELFLQGQEAGYHDMQVKIKEENDESSSGN
ncbi:DUF1934 domain-containing protein [Texcoconibacillus texcoconensis]|uniref:Uncharacterized beta-barrel protein YwiB (DUF1934 family) n=1 Tax=Texcoconibacillus texcoconensis TaxID=1095777 RepID=A0A840QRY6_9BACI|nr:DUF1934 domain-containing protein [Texcoconibacillus texcoconensis]MBB5174124.1 uncharacterized beta-barrel protein YwiB (DUF1934 family) [Texcoconibacillus texcoconensis]